MKNNVEAHGKNIKMVTRILKINISLLLILGCLFSLSCAKRKGKTEYTRLITKAYQSMRIGDWVFYKLTHDYSVMMQVVDKRDGEVVIKRRTYYMGTPVSASYKMTYKIKDIKRHLKNGMDIDGKIMYSSPTITQKSVEVDGKTLNCHVFTMKNRSAELAVFLSEEVPLDGVVMVTRNGVPVRKLIYFGRGGEPMKVPWTPDVEVE